MLGENPLDLLFTYLPRTVYDSSLFHLYNSVPIKDVLDGKYHYQILLNIKHCSPLTRPILIPIKEMVISSSSLVMEVMTTQCIRTGLLEADYYESRNRIKNPTLVLSWLKRARLHDMKPATLSGEVEVA